MTLGRGRLERRDIRIDAVFDIETEKWTEFVLGGLLTADSDYSEFDFRREDDYFDAILAVRGPVGKDGKDRAADIWSHNGGAFDMKWALDHLVKRGLEASVIAAGSRIISVKVRGGPRFLDSKALTKLSLAELTKSTDVQKQKLGFPCVNDEKPPCDADCEGYCAITRRMPAYLWKRLREYLEADCRSLLSAMFRVKRYALENDLDLGITIGSTAWSHARRTLELPSASLSAGDHRFARDGYFGGRVQLFRPRAASGHEYDVNSMYPSRLAFYPVPTGEALRSIGLGARRLYSDGAPGIFRAEVNVPEMHVPPLPVRSGTRVAYPFGKFVGTWARPELEYAESLGVEVTPLESLTFASKQILFREWVDKMFDLRANAPGGKSGALGTFLKFFLNSLTGKFGARPDNEGVIVNPAEIKACPGEGKCPGYKNDECGGWCGAYQPIGDSCSIFTTKRWRLDSCAHVEWAAFLTAEARVEWHKQATAVKGGWDLCYGDTDSIYSLYERAENIGKALGQWDYAGGFRHFVGVAPKVYRFERKENVKVKAKGLRLPKMKDRDGNYLKTGAEKADRMIQGGEMVSANAVIGFWAGARRAAVGGNFFTAAVAGRHVQRGFGDRILEPGSETTRAPRVDEVFDGAEREFEADYEL